MIILFTILFIISSVILYFLRTKKNVEIKTSDLTVAFVPIFIILLLTGAIEEFDFFGIKGKLKSTVEKKITDIEYELIAAERLIEIEKGGDAAIEHHLNLNPEALVFRIGKIYSPDIINKYINKIPSLTFIIIKTESQDFIGLMEISNYRKINDSVKFVEAIAANDSRLLSTYKPNLIMIDNALTSDKTRKDALEYFSNNEAMILPILDSNNKEFVGILRREVLTSILLQTIFKEIE